MSKEYLEEIKEYKTKSEMLSEILFDNTLNPDKLIAHIESNNITLTCSQLKTLASKFYTSSQPLIYSKLYLNLSDPKNLPKELINEPYELDVYSAINLVYGTKYKRNIIYDKFIMFVISYVAVFIFIFLMLIIVPIILATL